MNKEIIEYLKEKYCPLGLIMYGSFADGSNNLNSDFDALVISSHNQECHDHSYVQGIELDVFVYPKSKLDEDCLDDFIQIFDGQIVIDTDDMMKDLKEKVNAYIQNYPKTSASENEHSIAWCQKMLKRTKRNDMEGYYRLHWLLTESLKIYFEIKGLYYFGPKKALKQMQQHDETASIIYYETLKNPTYENVGKWIEILSQL